MPKFLKTRVLLYKALQLQTLQNLEGIQDQSVVLCGRPLHRVTVANTYDIIIYMAYHLQYLDTVVP